MVFLILGVSVGAVLIGVGLWYLLHNYGDLFSYNGLSKEHVMNVKAKLEEHYELLSSVSGKTFFGDRFWRGIYIGKDGGGYPLYYRYEEKKDGGVTFQLYPMLTELWSTNPNILGTKAR
jgi:hypothetical protein